MIDSDESFAKAREIMTDASRLLDNIMSSMGDGLSIQDRNMRIVYQNQFMIDNFGSHIGDYCYRSYEKSDSICDGCPIIEAFRTGKATKALRVGITKDGTSFRFENIASPLRNNQGEIVAGLELCRIVEAREKAFDDLREAMKCLEEARNNLVRSEKMAGIGQLAAGVAHEINNPAGFILCNLGAIRDNVREFFTYIESLEKLILADSREALPQMKNYYEGLRKVVDDETYIFLKTDLPEIIDESLQGINRIKDIVTGLLTFAHSTGEKMCPVDTNTLIETTLPLLREKIDNKKGRVVKSLGEIPAVTANPQQLSQMFLNILLNATQAIEEGGTITVKTYLKDNSIHIEIADDGVGIPENIIQNIFNPFFTTREVGQGVGLGLSVAYQIAANHKGSLDVQSKPGQGAIFTIKLPLLSSDEGSKAI